ncbi:MAG TPA: hypothetical protein VHL09_02605 [Dehalococcoidia bacterium]|nr:hypothetical protein [Dehalococcoidia bacterium]
MNWYLKKEFIDYADSIEAVTITYTCAPVGRDPDWTQAETRFMPAGEILQTGVGEVAKYGPPAPRVPQFVHPRLRKKVLKLPNEIYDEARDGWTRDYTLHYVYEIVQNGHRFTSPIYTDQIRSREITLIDPLGVISGTCVNWAVYDWDAPQFSPTEEEQFVARFGEDHPLRQFKFYGVENRESFGVAKKALIDTLPLPHRFSVRISAPLGALVWLRFHVGNWGLPEIDRWEDYWLIDQAFVMTEGAEPFVATPLGTQPADRPLTTCPPELLTGNPYAALVPGISAPAATEPDIVRAAEQILAESTEPVTPEATAVATPAESAALDLIAAD